MSAVDGISLRLALVRGCRVIVDADLARLYGVETRTLLQAVRRNPRRFPSSFGFMLTNQEVVALRSQFVISNAKGRGGRRHATWVFTEHGAIMAATVLSSARAIDVSVFVVRAFIQLREAAVANREITRQLDRLEAKVGTHDEVIGQILAAIRELAQPPAAARRRRIGFV